jgi:3-phosphoshikimate 1-carboxyvinyltransferase
MLAALADGTSTIHGALTSADARSSARVLRQLGAAITPLRPRWATIVGGRRGFSAPREALHCGNSGTTARLMLGLLAGHPFTSIVSGDVSLRRRPMRRVTAPLVEMGAQVRYQAADGLPLIMTGGRLKPLEWALPVASAQLKSALLLAGVVANVPVSLREPARTRDHTERILRHFGYTVHVLGGAVTFHPTGRIVPFETTIPGDPSSAIFLLAAAALATSGSVAIDDVGLNPSRIDFVAVLRRMGIAVATRRSGELFGEPRGKLTAHASTLQAVTLTRSEAPGVIDEIPMLACLAARAAGVSRFAGLAELRVKESDRLSLLAENLRRIGVAASIEDDDLIVTGTDAPLTGKVRTDGDHRIAMAFAVLGRSARADLQIDDLKCAGISFPGFAKALDALYHAEQS